MVSLAAILAQLFVKPAPHAIAADEADGGKVRSDLQIAAYWDVYVKQREDDYLRR